MDRLAVEQPPATGTYTFPLKAAVPQSGRFTPGPTRPSGDVRTHTQCSLLLYRSPPRRGYACSDDQDDEAKQQ